MRFFFCFLSFFFCASCLLAQQASGQEVVRRDLMLTGIGGWSGPQVFVVDESGKHKSVAILSGSFTGPIPGVAIPLQFYTKVQNPAEGQPPFAPAGDPIAVNPEIKKPLAIARWNKERSVPEAIIVEDDSSAVPYGSYQVINASGKLVGLRLKDTPLKPIAPNGMSIVDPKVNERTRSPYELLAEVSTDSGKELVASNISTMTFLVPTRRTRIIVIDDPKHPSGVHGVELVDYEEKQEAQPDGPPGRQTGGAGRQEGVQDAYGEAPPEDEQQQE